MALGIWWGKVLCYRQYNKISKDFYYNIARVSVLEDLVEDAMGLLLEMMEEGSCTEQITAAFQNTKEFSKAGAIPSGHQVEGVPSVWKELWAVKADSRQLRVAECRNFRILGSRVLWGLVECGSGGAL